MLITRSTPRITYRIGMRAWLEALADKSLPSLIADAEGEVAAAFKGIFKILMGNVAGGTKSWWIGHYQSTLGKWLLARVWQGKGLPITVGEASQKLETQRTLRDTARALRTKFERDAVSVGGIRGKASYSQASFGRLGASRGAAGPVCREPRRRAADWVSLSV